MDNWQRLEEVIKWTGMSVNSFAHHIGLKRSENLYQIKRGANGISNALARTITAKYPQISLSWLLAGAGTMFLDEANIAPVSLSRGVPFFNCDVCELKNDDIKKKKPAYLINIPIFDDCDMAAISGGNSMSPDIPQGAIVLLKSQEPSQIIPGESYFVESPRFCGIRVLRINTLKEGTLRLVPRNTADYDEIITDISGIKSLYLVRGIITNRNI